MLHRVADEQQQQQQIRLTTHTDCMLLLSIVDVVDQSPIYVVDCTVLTEILNLTVKILSLGEKHRDHLDLSVYELRE